MARGFSTTYGSGSTDKVKTTITASTTARTYACWTLRHGEGGGNVGRVFNTDQEDFFTSSANTKMQFEQPFSGVLGQWRFTRPAADQWHHLVLTYDGASAANDPVAYTDGASSAITVVARPTGTITASTFLALGNRDSDNARVWDGQLAEFALWNVALDAAEAAALGAGVCPLLIRRASLVEYVPMVRDNVSRLLAAPTITGTVVQPHPRVVYPRRRWGQGLTIAGGAVVVPPRRRMLMGAGI